MSFSSSKIESAPFLGEDADRYVAKCYTHITPSVELLSELPLPKNLKIRPFSSVYGSSKFLDAILDFDVRSDDVFVCSMPKCGSSWVQIIVWLLKHGLDYETTRSTDSEDLICTFNRPHGLDKRTDLFDNSKLNPEQQEAAKKKAYHEHFESYKSPRVFKSFFPVWFLPKSVWSKSNKIVYVVRNPMDMVCSEYHFLRNTYFFNAPFTMDDIVNGIVNDAWSISPRSDHIINYWNVSKQFPNVMFIAYEDLVKDAFVNIKKISEFLECKYTDQQLTELMKYVSFANMRKMKTINRETYVASMEQRIGKTRPDAEFQFLRKGKVGGYRDDLNEEQIQKLTEWASKIEQECDFKFQV